MEKAQASCSMITPGFWNWFGSKKFKDIYLATTHSGRLIVMNFVRHGMQNAQPRFRNHDKCLMVNSNEISEYDNDALYSVNHPDARLIECSPILYILAKLCADIPLIKREHDLFQEYYQGDKEQMAIEILSYIDGKTKQPYAANS